LKNYIKIKERKAYLFSSLKSISAPIVSLITLTTSYQPVAITSSTSIINAIYSSQKNQQGSCTVELLRYIFFKDIACQNQDDLFCCGLFGIPPFTLLFKHLLTSMFE
jgi:hypothetical protein